MNPKTRRELFCVLLTDFALAAALFVCLPMTMVKGVSDWIWIAAMLLCFCGISLAGLQKVFHAGLLSLGIPVFAGISLLCYMAGGVLSQAVELFGLGQGPLDPTPVWLDALILAILFVAAQWVLWRAARWWRSRRS